MPLAAWKSNNPVTRRPFLFFPFRSLDTNRHPTTSSQEVQLAHFQHSRWPVVPRVATATARTRCVADFEVLRDFCVRELACGGIWEASCSWSSGMRAPRCCSLDVLGNLYGIMEEAWLQRLARSNTDMRLRHIALPQVPVQPWCSRPQDSYLRPGS